MSDTNNRIKVGISSCLLGQEVRYDGGHKHSTLCTGQLAKYFDFVPTCPELGAGLGVPRPAIRLVGEPAAPRAVHVDDATVDVTQQLHDFAARRVPQLADLCGYVFIKNSPSCGLFRVKVYRDNGYPHQEQGRGLFAAALTRAMPLLPVEEDGRLQDSVLRENFITRVFAWHNWQELEREGLSAKALTDFHARYKYTLMAHGPQDYGALGRLLADAGRHDPVVLGEQYFTRLMQALQQLATRKTHANVLMHLQGYLKKQLAPREKEHMGSVIEQYRKGILPLVVPVTLLRHHFHQHPDPYIERQAYLQPYPDDLRLEESTLSRTLHWFRTDLRLDDNTALHAAASAGEVVALFIATPRQWDRHDDATIKRDYWRRNLLQLEQRLLQHGIPLLYAEVPGYADIPALLAQLLPALGVTALHCNREYPLFEQRRDAAVSAALQRIGISMQVHDDQTLVPPERVLNKSGAPFKVFTPFSKCVREVLQQAPVRALPPLPHQTLPQLPHAAPLRALAALEWPQPQEAWARLWPAGAEHAWLELRDFVATRISEYKQQRDFPGIEGTSKLSPQLAAGVLSVRQCWLASLQAEPNGSVFSWQNELLWRDFYKHVMFHFPRVCMGYNWRDDLGYIPWRSDEEDYRRWCQGRTGIPIVDAAMRQLLHTGWMHNRLRMIVAMFLSKHLLLDWRLGERWFMQHLVDGDFSANNGGWQWSASTGTDAAPYFRIFNPVTQSGRFDPDGSFIRRWVPELAGVDAGSIHDPGLLRPADYPAPMLDLGFGRERALNAFKVQE